MARKAKRGAWTGEWEGGRIWTAADGTETYYIRRQVDGHRYSVSTGCTTRDSAREQLRRFEAAPAAYSPAGDAPRAPIRLDDELVLDFLKWSKHEKRNSEKWVGQQRLYLAWWMEKLRGVDLRRARLRDHILPKLKGATCRPQRIATLKVLFSWLRTERHEIDAHEDPTFGTLKVPQSQPEQHRRVKAIPRDHLALVIENLASDRWRDLLRLLAGTGMHVSELERFAAEGSIEPLPRDGQAEGAAGVVVIPTTKGGEVLRVAVSADVVAAATRVRAAGTFDRQKLTKAIHSACAVAGIPAFGPGQLRHTVATAAVNAGADPASVAAFLGHKSPRTTRRFYATTATPKKVPTLA